MPLIIGRPRNEMNERTKAIRRDFARLYDTDKLRAELYNEQQGLCLICWHPLQADDSMCAQLDHAISIYMWAESRLPIDEAAQQANLRKNLIAVHIPCNVMKGGLDYEEFVARLESGDLSLAAPEFLSPERLQELKDEQSARYRKAGRTAATNGRAGNGGRIAGRISGRKNVENKTGAFGRSPEKWSEDSHKGGRIGGRATNATTNGRAGNGGRIGGRISAHNRWHVNRNIQNPSCGLCAAA